MFSFIHNCLCIREAITVYYIVFKKFLLLTVGRDERKVYYIVYKNFLFLTVRRDEGKGAGVGCKEHNDGKFTATMYYCYYLVLLCNRRCNECNQLVKTLVLSETKKRDNLWLRVRITCQARGPQSRNLSILSMAQLDTESNLITSVMGFFHYRASTITTSLDH